MDSNKVDVNEKVELAEHNGDNAANVSVVTQPTNSDMESENQLDTLKPELPVDGKCAEDGKETKSDESVDGKYDNLFPICK